MTRIRIVVGLALGLALGACSGDKEPSAPNPAAQTPSTEKQQASAQGDTDSAAAVMAVDAVMVPYEQCRALLAADTSEGVAACARAMSDAAEKGEATVTPAAVPHMKAIAAAAGELATVSADDLAAVRLAYGEVSKPVVALLTASPEAAKKYHVFECPMAKGYQRWAQADAKLTNPYMGTQMLECGTEVHDHHQGMMGGDKHGMNH